MFFIIIYVAWDVPECESGGIPFDLYVLIP